ncbi:fumarylacetoacetate hydrolase family protein [Microvirga sp. 2MCAF38]|uniref:fumarylacetoacetate hydrolase family protein n=1 Tax=Microvirga sp. 2MCAF38 TaxID=3232989 RepID=UPI003F976366
MRLISFHAAGRDRFGIVIGDGVFDLSERTTFSGVRDVVARNGMNELEHLCRGATPDYRLDEIVFRIPVPDADKIICVGVNYPDRNAEYKDGSDLPKFPSLFLRTRGSFVGHGQPILLPPESPQLDYEGELVVVIGKGGRRIPRESALEHIFGLSICNEGSVRDWMRHAKFNVTQGKNFDASGSIGPWIDVLKEPSGLGDLHLRTWVNGDLRQEDKIERMIFPIDYLIHYISTFTTLQPGDLIVTGTPTGSGARFDPPRFLHDGDSVRVEISGVGVLENKITVEK